MSACSYWDTGPGDPGRPVIKFTKIKSPAMQVVPLPCTLCKKPFYQFVHLQQHSRSHSGRRPFKCHVCHRSFIQLSHLLKHRYVKHEVKKKCQRCGSVYSRWSRFLHHTIQAHGVRSLVLPKLKQTVKQTVEKPEVEQTLKPIKLCIKKSVINMAAKDNSSERQKAKKRKKHKKHKKEKKSKQSKQNTSSDIKVQCADSTRIILKFKMSKDSNENHGEPSTVVNKDSSPEQKANVGAANTTGSKPDTFTELVQSPSPKDSGIDDCSPLHETDHNENCSSNSACVKSGDSSKHSKDRTPPVTSAMSSSTPPTSLSTAPPTSSSSMAPAHSPRRPTRQDAALRSLMSVRDTAANTSAPSTPDNRKTAESYATLKPRSSPRIKQEVCHSPRNPAATPSPYTDAEYIVPPSPSTAPPLKLTISKKPAGKLRGTKYTSSLHVSPEFVPPISPCESYTSKSPRALSESPRTYKRSHSPGKYPPGMDQTEIARLIYLPDTSMTRSPRPAKSPRLCHPESTIYTPRHQPSLSPAHSMKSERDLGPLNVDIGDDPYAFDDDPCNTSPHLLPYTSTLPKRSDKYKLDPPVLEPQIMHASFSDPNDGKHKTRPKLTKQVDLKKGRGRKSPACSVSKDGKVPRTPKSGKRGKLEAKLLPFIKQEIMDSPVDDPMPTLTHNMETAPPTGSNSVTTLVQPEPENITAEHTKQKDLCSAESVPEDRLVPSATIATSAAESVEQTPVTPVNVHANFDVSTPSLPSEPPQKTETLLKEKEADKTIEPVKSVREADILTVNTTSNRMQSPVKTNNVENMDGMKKKTVERPPSVNHDHPELTSLPPDIVGDVLSKVSKGRSTDRPAKKVSYNGTTTPDDKPQVPAVDAPVTASGSNESAEEPIEVGDVINDSDLLLSDPQLENLSFNDSFLELGNDAVPPGVTSEALFDDLHESESPLQTLDTASKASTIELKRKAESDPIVITLPGEAGMAPMSLVIDNDDSDHFGESDDDDFDLASSLSSAPLAVTSLASSHSSSSSIMNSTPLKKQPLSATAAVVDTDSEFADLQSNCNVNRVASKPPVTGFFDAFASFVGAKQPMDHGPPGYCSEFAKFLSQKSSMGDDSVFGDYDLPSRIEVEELKLEHLRVEKLCEQVWKLMRSVFPSAELPVYRSSTSCCGIETLIKRVEAIVKDQESLPPQSEPSISLCAKPHQCLAHLRTKVCDLLVSILPDLCLPPAFSRTGDEVDELVDHVLDANIT